MKILIVSDIHGGYENMKKILEDNPSFDYLFLLGDILSSNSEKSKMLAELLNSYNQKIVAVRGNCDYINLDMLDFSVTQPYVTIPVDHKLYFLTHGHLYDRYNTPNSDYDVYIQGHTHIPKMELDDGKLFLNPGSVSLPRGMSKKSYIFCNDLEFQLKSVEENKVLKKINM